MTSGSNKRRRRHVVSTRLTNEERSALVERADEVGLTLGDYTRSVLLERQPLGVKTRRRVPSSAVAALDRVPGRGVRAGDHLGHR
ncbi:MAG: hypothetical protein WCJ64_03535, partial [Rhodospirillaceae bacterium]